ncbi:hypothetical protein E2562_015720 [Oryza meyeriana var. granulata]|uniref:DUF4378 domain-containing protein n=1 Tax=Oryza meyeriana var. granulata TaxID=110450 RepID=A0A6G1D623_9ORYZ|nr:hypothetical protein E2562_015720 [Oryza meyeriana var. granulata]
MPPARVLGGGGGGLADDAPELERQMGCMAGIFQIFDRQRLLTARRSGGRHSARKMLPPGSGHTLPRSSSNVPAQSSSTSKIVLEKTFSKSMTENSSLSIESSRASCSSSSCSSFSSLDGNKSIQQELPYISEQLFVQRPLKSSPSLKDPVMDTKSGQPNIGFRDIVKDSINRDTGGLTVKTSVKEARRNGQYKDSPRPLLLSKSMDGTYVIGIDRSTKAPVNAVESSRRFPEQSRFSCDDRRLLRPVEAHENKKPSTRLKELPRLSLDSRKESLNPSSRLKNFSYRRTDDSLMDTLKPQDSPGHRRASSVIAKLMGLEEAPNATGMLSSDSYEPARSPRPAEDTQKEHPVPSPRRYYQNACESLPKDESSAMKTKPSPRILTEAAPWRQQEKVVNGSKALQCRDAEVRPRTSSLYAYIERRGGGLEFLECNKDFRALRILEALHAKDAKRQSDGNGALPVAAQQAGDALNTSSRHFQPPIVVMKPARSTEKQPGVSLASVDPLAGFRSLRKLQARDATCIGEHDTSTNEKAHSRISRAQTKSDEPVSRASSPRPTGSSSPRPVQRKAESERRSRPPVSPKSPSKKSNEAASPGGRTRTKPSRGKSHRDNEVSKSPRSRIGLVKEVDVGIMDFQKPLVISSSFVQPSNTALTPSHKGTPSVLASDQKINSLENSPSPVSVLDTSYYHTRLSYSFKDGEIHTSEECWNPNSLPDTPQSKTSSEVSQIKSENFEALIQKLEQLQSMNDEAANTKDHQYIYEILLASGLLHKELSFLVMPGQAWSSSCLINPELFLILEQTKPDFSSATQTAIKSSKANTEKLHRRLVFDLVNEITAQKMSIHCSASQSAKLLRLRKYTGWRLFKDLCTEVDRLQSECSAIKCSEEDEDERMLLVEDPLNGIEDWSFDSESPSLVLEIERLIYKDLVDEVIRGEAGKMQGGQWKLRRQLSFSSTS